MDFKRLFKLICDEWERTIMSTVMLSLLVYLSVVAYNMLTESEGSSQNNVKPKSPHLFFDTTSTSYVEPVNLSASINPFNFHIKVPLPPPPKPTPQNNQTKPQPNNTPKTPDKTPPKDNGKKPTPVTPPQQQTGKQQPQQQQQSKLQPPKNTRKIAIQYRGYLRGTTDEQLAFYSAQDSKSKKTEAKSAKEGAKIHGVLPIKSFDADQLVLVQDGKDVIVKRGKKQEIIIQ